MSGMLSRVRTEHAGLFLLQMESKSLRIEPCHCFLFHSLDHCSTPGCSGPVAPQEEALVKKRTAWLPASAFRVQVVKPWYQADLVTWTEILSAKWWRRKGVSASSLERGVKVHSTESPSQAQKQLPVKALL